MSNPGGVRIVRGAAGTVALAVLIAAMAALTAAGRAAADVHIRGTAYTFIFNKPLEKLDGARIGVAELPGVHAVAGAEGAYDLRVPDDTNVTPYADAPGHQRIYLQTFHTSGRDLENVNFQIPETSIYRALAAVVGAPIDPDTGDPVKCAIVSTFSTYRVRGVGFMGFVGYGAHGVAGATATGSPALPPAIYFNSSVIPDRSQPSSSDDGGVLFYDVPEGVYTVSGHHPSDRFASFVATCRDGRLINANPPWGLYQLYPGEQTDPAALLTPDRPKPPPPPKPPSPPPPADTHPADTAVRVSLRRAKIVRGRGRKRVLKLKLRAREPGTAVAKLNGRGRRLLTVEAGFGRGGRRISSRISPKRRGGKVRLRLSVRDRAGNHKVIKRRLWLPKLRPKAKRGHRR